MRNSLISLSAMIGCLLFSSLLTGCGFVQTASDTAHEVVIAGFATGGVKNYTAYETVCDKVNEAAGGAENNGADAELKALLEKDDLADEDRALLTYHLARYQGFQGNFKDSFDNFDKAISLTSALDPQPGVLLAACYLSYSRILAKAGRKEESKEYKQKYEAAFKAATSS